MWRSADQARQVSYWKKKFFLPPLPPNRAWSAPMIRPISIWGVQSLGLGLSCCSTWSIKDSPQLGSQCFWSSTMLFKKVLSYSYLCWSNTHHCWYLWVNMLRMLCYFVWTAARRTWQNCVPWQKQICKPDLFSLSLPPPPTTSQFLKKKKKVRMVSRIQSNLWGFQSVLDFTTHV